MWIQILLDLWPINQKQAEDIINYHRFLYYEVGRPMLSDYKYDILENTLKQKFPHSIVLHKYSECPAELLPIYLKRYKRHLEFKEKNNLYI